MYADDTSLIMSGNNLKTLIKTVNSELCLLNTWYNYLMVVIIHTTNRTNAFYIQSLATVFQNGRHLGLHKERRDWPQYCL